MRNVYNNDLYMLLPYIIANLVINQLLRLFYALL